MKVSELIRALEDFKAREGDIQVAIEMGFPKFPKGCGSVLSREIYLNIIKYESKKKGIRETLITIQNFPY